jgi:Flp pilus assembly protein TadG
MKLFRLSSQGRKEAGQSMVEVAMVLVPLTILALGTYDVSRALHAKNLLANMSREGANLALRGSRSVADLQAVMTSLAATAQPLEMDKKGMMYVYEVNVKDGVRTVNRVAWDKNPAGPCSKIDNNDPSSLAGTVPVANGGSVCIFETVYSYKSVLLPSYTPQLHSTTVF